MSGVPSTPSTPGRRQGGDEPRPSRSVRLAIAVRVVAHPERATGGVVGRHEEQPAVPARPGRRRRRVLPGLADAVRARGRGSR